VYCFLQHSSISTHQIQRGGVYCVCVVFAGSALLTHSIISTAVSAHIKYKEGDVYRVCVCVVLAGSAVSAHSTSTHHIQMGRCVLCVWLIMCTLFCQSSHIYTHAGIHAHTHARTHTHTHIHTHAHAHTHTRTHVYTHTNTDVQGVTLVPVCGCRSKTALT